MRNFLRKAALATGVFLTVLAALSLNISPPGYVPTFKVGTDAWAQLSTPTRNPVPRLFQTQQKHYTRFTVAFNSCVYVSLVCSVKVGALPYNAFITNGFFQTTTTWNAGTSASVGLGTVTPAVNIRASTNDTAAGNGTAMTMVAGGLGVSVTGNAIAQTGSNGGFDLFATITIVGALPTAGQTTYVLEWVAPNDGSCVTVGLGATSVAC